MKNLPLIIAVTIIIIVSTACRNSAQNGYSSPDYSNGSSTSSKPAATDIGLTDSKVETAVNAMLADWRLGGNVRVKGIQELPQQNSASADFKPKTMPQGQDRLPSMEEMFPQKKAVYSKDGKAILSRYTDGRWVLKEVRWGFDTGIKGTVEIR